MNTEESKSTPQPDNNDDQAEASHPEGGTTPLAEGDAAAAPHEAGVVPPGAPDETDDDGNAEELLREHDTASRFRTGLGWWAWLVGGLSIALTLFHLYTGLYGSRPSLIQGAIHIAGATSIIFLLYPINKRTMNNRGVPWYDAILSLLGLGANLYIVFEYTHLTSNIVRITGFRDLDYIVATLGILLVLEATRRCVGLPIVIIATVAIIYSILGAGISWENYVVSTFFTARSGIFGTPIQVSSTFIFLFLLFAVVLVRTNIGAFFNDLAFRAAGRYAGGPAKAAVAASGLQGMVSGSSVANTVASGSFTIPIMKRAGFRPHVAAATEATASTGGQLMPPIMGAAAFIMAEYTQIPYSQIIIIGIIPALLYFAGVFLAVHFEAKATGIKGLPKQKLPEWKGLVKRIDLLLPLIVIVYMLMDGFSPARAALWGIGVAFVLSFFRKDTRLSPMDIVRTLEAGARTALPVIAACATAGIVAGTVTSTGLGARISSLVLDIAGGNFLLVLFMTMIACLILGMGLPTTANYVVTATVAAPILYNNFDVPLIAAHMFVFFFGILADITPPVCLAAYAGSGIAGSNPMRTGVMAVRLAVAAFLIPYVFVLEPSLLLEGPFTDLLPALTTLILGMTAIAGGLAGYLVARSTVMERTLLVVGGALMVYPAIFISLAGLAVVAAVVLVQIGRRRKNKQDPELAEASTL